MQLALDILLIARDLSAICNSSGYVHALACLCLRDSVVRYWVASGNSYKGTRTAFTLRDRGIPANQIGIGGQVLPPLVQHGNDIQRR